MIAPRTAARLRPSRQESSLRPTDLLRPLYADSFRCIGAACEDTCCGQDWTVDIDRAAYQKFQALPAGPLRSLIDASVLLCPESIRDADPDRFAQIPASPSCPCPLLSRDRLCRIQAELGEAYLAKVCATFPRRIAVIDQLREQPLSLSCPEAARLVLLNPHPAISDGKQAQRVRERDPAQGRAPLRNHFWSLRGFSIRLVRNRAYPLWQRVFLLGSFARRLDAIAKGEANRGVDALLRDFQAAIEAGGLRSAMEAIPARPELQFDFLLRLVMQHREGIHRSPRLVETLHAFLQGVGCGRETTLEGQIALYAEAHRRYFAPFFRKHPHILENYLLNLLFYRHFPFGRKLFEPQATPEPSREFAELAMEFALVKGLLIGVAGHYREAFSSEHVVQTVQSAFKHFEHNRQFLQQANQLLAATHLDNAQGLTMLLRN